VPGEDDAALRRRIDDFVAGDLLPRLRSAHPDAAISTETAALVPPLVPDPLSPAEALARELTGANETTTIAFATEAGLFQAAGIPAVICGPGSIDVAHQPNEYVTRAQFAEGAAFLDRLLAWAREGGR
jgi:acetylornithine deacetylase